ncbi:MAG: type I secretion system permease/ATPase [Alphaproteobacteria bacterium]|jgi:ATP-binding cassette subfamily C protein|nr:type I secretion system permease/ATPase [Alphaproteobacteria bacterium]MBU1560025.1 type I secretion system permease/ATPase [Alphaproteobacteria bacterium]MBU2302327.1 type I secretion system permease/ATPase [Alphaproteobacteria bacterium]MBU2369399.1 type I secretion system permease/ATPase [Alphaproteobacteria bacterium]
MATNAKAMAEHRGDEMLRKEFKGVSVFVFWISGIINVLALTGSFYMLQIYDRALTSGSIPTLLALSVLVIGLYLFQGVFDVIRSQLLVRMGARFDRMLAPIAHRVSVDMPRFGFSTGEALERGRDVDTIRTFMGSQGPVALFDLPWVPLYILFVYFLHPVLGAVTLGGAIVLALLTVWTELRSRKLASAAQQAQLARNAVADSNARNADIIKAMGISSRAVSRFNTANQDHLTLQTRASDVIGTFGAFSRVLRMVLQSALLGLGAYLTIQGQMSAGAIIAVSVAASRALAPIDMAIANWKGVVAARQAFKRLRDTMIALSGMARPLELPAPTKSFKVDKITVAAPATGRVLLTEVAFELKAGQALGVIGPSGGGKTTLVRALTGIWPALRGSIRLDDADLTQWDEDKIGEYVGYLPQDVALLDGTIVENITRLAPQRDARAIVAATKAAGVHEMIVRLPDGYDTQLGPMGTALSAGQRQRIGLARALYGDPFVVIMDEPNAFLDAEGEQALNLAIRQVRARGGIAIVVAHRPSILAEVDMVAVIQNGRMSAFGPKDEIVAGQRQANVNAPRIVEPRAEAGEPA